VTASTLRRLHALRLALCINLKNDDKEDAGPSLWHGGDVDQGCST
jgi:hypothetical protein